MPKKLNIISWNVNGIRACYKKGLLDFINEKSPDILCLQETKALMEQLPKDLQEVSGYEFYINPAEIRKGYSGVGIYTKVKPNKVECSMLGADFRDEEGRIIILTFDEFTLLNMYFPNGGKSKEHFEYKLKFYEKVLEYSNQLRKSTNVIVCGDVNAAHTEIDLARPKENEKNIGFLPVERDWISRFIASGFIDTFRKFNNDNGNYSWWDMKTRARERNVGWRIDYFFINNELESNLLNASILSDVAGSDHCPISIEIEI